MRRRHQPSPSRRVIIDIAVIFGAALILRVATYEQDLFEWLNEFSRAHESWELDEVFITIAILSLALIVFCIRRILDLRREMRLRLLAERRSLRVAQYDPLTGLPNRRQFREDVTTLAKADGLFDAILLIDLDGFTPINDTLGQAAGDDALRTVAQRLRSLDPDNLTCARVGGDEFAILAKGLTAPQEAEKIAERALAAVGAPIETAGSDYHLNASVGIAVIDHRSTPEEHLRQANLALHVAKRQAKSSYIVYDVSMDSAMTERLRVERELRQGILAGETIPYYQPIVDLTSGRVIKFEALARWKHPERGWIPPNKFIPIAEERGLIEALTDTIIRQACADALDWPRRVALSVNLSPVLLESAAYPLRLVSLLGELGIDTRRIELEITESALATGFDTVRSFLDQFRALGVRFALDDFGTGYSSLLRLQGLRLDEIKVDGSFVQNMTHSSDAAVIVHSIIELGHGLGMTVTAEGVETPEQRRALLAEGCEHGQGYLFGRPVPAWEAVQLLSAQRGSPHVAAVHSRTA